MKRKAAAQLVTAALLTSGSACHRPTPGAEIAAPDAAPAPPQSHACGPLWCEQFDDPAEAFDRATAGTVHVLAIGEVHAPRNAQVPSAATRFRSELLPRLQGRASDLLLELMAPPTGCARTTAQVKEKQAPVHAEQAPQDQDEYLALGEAARTLGVVPDLLRPTCDDLERVRRASDPIVAALTLTKTLTVAQAERLLARDAASATDRGKTVVLYGGALHNDLHPKDQSAPFSYAPALDRVTSGGVRSVTLIVPEFIGDSETWRAMPFYPHYDRARLGAKTTLYRTGERSFTLVFAETAPRPPSP